MTHSPLTGDNPFYHYKKKQVEEGWFDDMYDAGTEIFKQGSKKVVGSLDIDGDGDIDKDDFLMGSKYVYQAYGIGARDLAKKNWNNAVKVTNGAMARMSDYTGDIKDMAKALKIRMSTTDLKTLSGIDWDVFKKVDFSRSGDVFVFGNPQVVQKIKNWGRTVKEGKEGHFSNDIAGMPIVGAAERGDERSFSKLLSKVLVAMGLITIAQAATMTLWAMLTVWAYGAAGVTVTASAATASPLMMALGSLIVANPIGTAVVVIGGILYIVLA